MSNRAGNPALNRLLLRLEEQMATVHLPGLLNSQPVFHPLTLCIPFLALITLSFRPAYQLYLEPGT